MNENDLATRTIGLAMEVHSALGPGLLESAYEECLNYKFEKSGLFVERQKAVPLVFEDVKLACGYRVDLLVERRLVLEIKSVEALHPLHFAQVLTYLKLGDYRLGLLMNFNTLRLKDGIRRVINGKI